MNSPIFLSEIESYSDRSLQYYTNYQSFELPKNYNLIFIHMLTSTEILNHVIKVASETYSFIIDTQQQQETYLSASKSIPALIQIQFNSFQHAPLVLLVEVLYLKSNFTTRTRDYTKEQQIQQLFKQIFSRNKYVFAWGNPLDKLALFYRYELFNENDLKQLNLIDLHERFRDCRILQCVYDETEINTQMAETIPGMQDYKKQLHRLIIREALQLLDPVDGVQKFKLVLHPCKRMKI
ncbi:unnamed protein product [Rotaria sp. Silwood2]|nr:unnamed protein product [Rotaria sp. Silwood2]CAF3339961.1 unnamed protein product [Rotaria sp. Silwood2]CAF4222862.1 unnamed protein product [Rotaria sp. Silwood2]CAF4316893.1 unnamed protein product [Rotaria sp. Silwood2]